METGLKFMSPREADRLLGVETSTIYVWIRTGRLPAFRLPSGYFRIRQVDLQSFLTPVRNRKKKDKQKHEH